MKYKPDGKTELPARQLAFAKAYWEHNQNAAKAARAVGYAPSRAKQTAWRLMQCPHVLEAIDAAETAFDAQEGARWAAMQAQIEAERLASEAQHQARLEEIRRRAWRR